MSMNVERHSKSFIDMFQHRIAGEFEKADAIKAFYQEYFAIMDLSADFYLETIEHVFQKAALPQGKLTFRGEPVDLRTIRKTFLLTVEGERDDICAVGQTLAAQDLCSGLKPYMKSHHMQPGVGHYGVFSGRRWESKFIRSCAIIYEQACERFQLNFASSKLAGGARTFRVAVDIPLDGH